MRKKSSSGNLLKVASIAILCLLALSANSTFGNKNSEATKENSPMGEIKIEGKHIERLVLQCSDGKRETFNQPGETISLAAGEYPLWEIYLEGGFIYYAWRLKEAHIVTVTEDKQAVLKFGAPLEQKVKVSRTGQLMTLDYELTGVGGENYTGGNRGRPPTFTIYKGEKKIASSSFEYG